MAGILNKAKCKVEEAKDTLDQMKGEYKYAIAEAKRVMNKEQYFKCCLAIHSISGLNVAVGMIPFPGVDAIPISAAQVGMVVKLGSIFGKKISDTAAKAAISTAVATLIGRTAVKIIPGVGLVVSGAVAGVVTETIGWIVAVNFAKTTNNIQADEEAFNEKDNEQKNEEQEQSSPSLEERAQSFLSGEKDVNIFRKEYDQLIKDFEEILDSLEGNDPLRKVYDDLTLFDL